MRVGSYLPSALALLLQAADALPYKSAGGEQLSSDELTKRVATAAATGNQTGVLSGLLADKPTKPAPTTEVELQASLAAIWSGGSSTNFYVGIKAQIDVDIGLPNLSSDLVAPYTALGATNNSNPKNPKTKIYPQKSKSDAPYSLPEADLRAAIFIPSSFTYGKKPPLIFVPGTGGYGGENFANNLLKLLSDSSVADPVWLNIPGAQLGDAQSNAEHVAYAINYISGISSPSSKVSLVTWSQGGLDAQWAFTFWPSTRSVVSDLVAVSPDFHGTVLAPVLCLSPGKTDFDPCPPSVIQQEYDSAFVAALRAKGGADAWVPTTTVYSSLFDEIVEPQQGIFASAFLGDARGVGVTNVEVQTACLGRPAGGFYGHSSLMFSPLTAALVVDALGHAGPANLGRMNLGSVCETYVAPGLTVGDAIATAGQIVTAAVRLLAYQPRLTSEPALRSYAM